MLNIPERHTQHRTALLPRVLCQDCFLGTGMLYLGTPKQLLEAGHHGVEPVLVLRAVLRPTLQKSNCIFFFTAIVTMHMPNAACAAV